MWVSVFNCFHLSKLGYYYIVLVYDSEFADLAVALTLSLAPFFGPIDQTNKKNTYWSTTRTHPSLPSMPIASHFVHEAMRFDSIYKGPIWPLTIISLALS